jgi:hypothetical protein
MKIFTQRAMILIGLVFVIFAYQALSPLHGEDIVTSFAVQASRILMVGAFIQAVDRIATRRIDA